MTIYFFSKDFPDSKMLQDVGGIDCHFTGTIQNVTRRNERSIGFEENGESRIIEISSEDLIIAVISLDLQIEWLNALQGQCKLLIPQMNPTVDEYNNVKSFYSGLLWVQEIKIKSKQWSGSPVNQKLSQITTLRFNGYSIRFIDGKTVGEDVARALGYAFPSEAVYRLVDTEYKTFSECCKFTFLEPAGVYQLIYYCDVRSVSIEFDSWFWSAQQKITQSQG